MAGPQVPNSAILYQNAEKSITLIDLPTSISQGQGLRGQALPSRTLLSSEPLREPYHSTEPKGETAKANVMARLGSYDHRIYRDLVCNGLRDITEHHWGHWCLPRQLSPMAQVRRGKKRKLNDVDLVNENVEHGPTEPDISLSRERTGHTRPAKMYSRLELSPSSTSRTSVFPDMSALSRRLVHNPRPDEIDIHLSSPSSTYHIPPGSSFFLTGIDDQTVGEFSKAASGFYSSPSSSAGPGQFDFILLDPPWQNRSVRRSRKYKTMRDCDPMVTVQGMLGNHIAPKALIACWITNKASSREAVLTALKDWDVELIEEWVWLKTTACGEPVYDINGVWRRPFEVLLVGRKVDWLEKSQPVGVAMKETIKRLIVGVPDVHSRKPCLRDLIEPMMPDACNYRALEIFARNLTAGWWAWGDEVLKFNWEKHWAK
ncbi:MAG: hypothetical protein Q9187_007145 [Circinaria calcarea]